MERESAARRKSFIMMFRVGAVLLSKKKGSWWYSRSFGFMGDWGLGWSTVLFRPAGEYVFTIDNKHKREVLLAQTQRLVLLGGNRFLPAKNTLFPIICLIAAKSQEPHCCQYFFILRNSDIVHTIIW